MLYVAATYIKNYIRSVFFDIQGRYVRFLRASYKLTAMTTLREHLSNLGRKGGEARAKKMTKQERSDSARRAVEARWAKERAQTKALREDAQKLLTQARKRQAAVEKRADQ